MTEEKSIYCKECGWQFPEELFLKLLDVEPIYCESCGAEIYKRDYDIQHITHLKTKQKQKTLVETLLSIAKKKSIEYRDKVKSKIKEIKEKPQD